MSTCKTVQPENSARAAEFAGKVATHEWCVFFPVWGWQRLNFLNIVDSWTIKFTLRHWGFFCCAITCIDLNKASNHESHQSGWHVDYNSQITCVERGLLEKAHQSHHTLITARAMYLDIFSSHSLGFHKKWNYVFPVVMDWDWCEVQHFCLFELCSTHVWLSTKSETASVGCLGFKTLVQAATFQ